MTIGYGNEIASLHKSDSLRGRLVFLRALPMGKIRGSRVGGRRLVGGKVNRMSAAFGGRVRPAVFIVVKSRH